MVKFGETQGEIIDEEGEVVAMASKTRSLYYLRCEPMINERINSATDQAGENLWHRRYGHLGERNLSKLKILVKLKNCTVACVSKHLH